MTHFALLDSQFARWQIDPDGTMYQPCVSYESIENSNAIVIIQFIIPGMKKIK